MKRHFWIKTNFITLLFNSILLFSTIAQAEDSSSQTIKVGMTTALSGPAQELGQSMKVGVQTYFDSVNASNGINGKKIELITLDDQYEPTLAAPNMRELIDKKNVIAVIGNVGTPTAVVTVPIANEMKTLLFGAYTGAGILRKNPPDRYIINLRASYAEETATMIKGLLSIGIKPDEMAFFTQNDAYGDSGYEGAMNALKAAGYDHPELLAYGRYTRNTLNVEEGLVKIISTGKTPRAIIMVGAYAPNAKFILLAKKEFPNAIFLNVSFVGTNALAKQLGKEGNNVVITQVVPYFDTSLSAIKDYRRDLDKYFPGTQPGLGSLEGYLAAKLFVMGLQEAAKENNLTREGLIDAFEKMQNVDLGIGEKINFDKTHHQALHAVWPTLLKNGNLVPLTSWSMLSTTKNN